MKDPSMIKPEQIDVISTLKQRIKELEQSESDLKRAEERLRESQAKFRKEQEFNQLLLDTSPALIVAIGFDGKTLMMNQALLDVLEYTKEEITGADYMNVFVPEEDRGTLAVVFQEIVKEGKATVNENRIRSKSGRTYLVEWHGRTVNTEGDPNFFVGVGIDITKRKQTEKVLKESEEKYRGIFENAVEGVFQIATDGHFISVNPAMARIYGAESPEEMMSTITNIGQSYVDHQEKRRYQDLIERDGMVNNFESQFCRKDGAVIWLSINAHSVNDEAGKTLYYEGMVEDITPRKNAEQRLMESEERYRTAIEFSNDGVSLLRESRHIYVNRRFLEIYGYDKPEEALGKGLDLTIHPDDRQMVVERNRRRERGERVTPKYEFKGIRKDGTTVYVEISTARITFHGEPATLAYHRDITKRKVLEQKLQAISITDELTGLYNRRGFFILSQQQLKLARRTGKKSLLFFADLDKLKWINDTIGHQEGDMALFETARVLKDTFRETDVISRMGGDEFAVLAIDINDKTAMILLGRLQTSLNVYNAMEARKYKLSLSVGMAQYDPQNPVSLDVLISHADTLMYEEKRKKQGRV
jgi:diguanylate cyclase (GGDEF)-like protein/PAS domain S-box-containing protein